MKAFAKQLRQERGLHAWSQEQLAEMVGTTAPNVSRWERGVTLPSLYFRQKLCELFGKTAEELGVLEGANDSNAQAPDQAGEAAPPSVPPGASSLFWNLPHQRNPLFTGREEALLLLHQALNAGEAGALTQAQAISGLGGIGKTALAMEYAYRYSDEYRSIFWVRGEISDVLLTDFAAIAGVLNLPEQEQQTQHQTVEAVKRWLEQHTHWLLIVDNIEELSLLREFIPFKSKGHIILTTRSQSTGSFIQRLDLYKMESDEGALFLLRRAKRIGPGGAIEQALAADRLIAREISLLLDGLPLALDQAGAYIEEAACSLPHYCKLLQSHRAMLLDLRHLSGGMDDDHPHSVYATLTLSFEQIKQANPAAIDLLRLCAFLHPDAIPEEMITEAIPNLSPLLQEVASSPLKYDAMIAELRRYSLLHRNPETKTFSIHRLAQAVLRDSMDDTTKRQWAQRAVQVVNRVFPAVDQWVTSSLCQRYFSHAQVCAALIEEWDITCREAGRLLTELACYMYELFQYELMQYAQAEPLLTKALAILTPILEAEQLLVAKAQEMLGWVCTTLGQYRQAEACYQQTLAILQRFQPSNHYGIACCLSDMAEIYSEQGRYDIAEPLYQQALEISEHIREPEHLDVAVDLRNLGVCYSAQGKHGQAESLLVRALDISQKALGLEHPLTAGILHALGRLYLEQRLYDQAERLLLQAFEIRQKVLKPGHPSMAFSLNELGRLYLEQEQCTQAEPALRQALEISLKTLGPEHPKTVPILNNLIRLCRAKGEERETEALFQRTLEINQKALEPEQYQTAQLPYELIAFCSSLGARILPPTPPSQLVCQVSIGLQNEGPYEDLKIAHKEDSPVFKRGECQA